MTVDQQEIKFIDIATGLSAVQCTVDPRKMPEVALRWANPAGSDEWVRPKVGLTPPLAKAVRKHDLDAFVHIADLYQSLALSIQTTTPDAPLRYYGDILFATVLHDQVDILDEYIRRTGEGLDTVLVKKNIVEKAEEESPAAINDANKMHLGLNVHGKKHINLTRKNDSDAATDAGQETKTVPLLWKAIRLDAKGFIEYLGLDRPFAAYKAYSTSIATHGDEKARWTRRVLFDGRGAEASDSLTMDDAEGRLTVLLGEFPLVGAMIGNDVEMTKLLEKVKPDLMAQALSTNGCNSKIISYLLSNNLSPEERDSNRGWNICHYICDGNNKIVLEHFLLKLSREINEGLLKQQSKGRFNTLLHLAVKKGNVDLLRAILDYLSATAIPTFLQIRDADGQTPLHCAVRRSFTRITKVVLDASKFVPSSSSNSSSCVVTTARPSLHL
ncbi:hypothetical protein CVT25_005509 [Psilocybe cyanescens]|uniref:Uncharacterized protein n=1 Tax=Psilocybe cyanescens TaxID=93625 RepID=A0A409X662_PSICY|nr:hypothetical protein CVT25_005509 [Psilocybe cyanescens]